MLKFAFGVLIGVAAKAVYDLFQDDQPSVVSGLQTGRLEALVDETRQLVRELRDEVRRAVTPIEHRMTEPHRQ